MNCFGKILILTDYRGYLCGKLPHESGGMVDVSKIIGLLGNDFEVECCKYGDIDFGKRYRGWYVIYAASEERGLMYEDFMEDILLSLKYGGAILVPDFKYFRAHANKVFQELIRKQFVNEELRLPNSTVIGRMDEIDIKKYSNFPYIVKMASGSGSIGVRLVKNKKELEHVVTDLTYVDYHDANFKKKNDWIYNKLVWKAIAIRYGIRHKQKLPENPRKWMHSNKIIVQDFIPGLNMDYKVLYYYGKYYVLRRHNRKGDFRASGSGLFEFPLEVGEIENILNFAEIVVEEISTPMVSLDIGMNKEGKCYLIEFQCVCFGPYTLQYSKFYFVKKNGLWVKIKGVSDLETEFARSIREYLIAAINNASNI